MNNTNLPMLGDRFQLVRYLKNLTR